VDSDVWVGVDPRRLHAGGATSNASSFFDQEGLVRAKREGMLLLAHQVDLETFPEGLEIHAFFLPEFFAEYLLHSQDIHSGGPFVPRLPMPPTPQTRTTAWPQVPSVDTLVVFEAPGPLAGSDVAPSQSLVDEYEAEGNSAFAGSSITLEQFRAIVRRAAENGEMGEELILARERERLIARGRPDLADRVSWVSRDRVGAGYDIASFDEQGNELWIEVKSTSGKGGRFFLTERELQVARTAGDKYTIHYVTDVRSNRPRVGELGNPWALKDKGSLTLEPDTWRASLIDWPPEE